jgi:hypothetical protein
MEAAILVAAIGNAYQNAAVHAKRAVILAR